MRKRHWLLSWGYLGEIVLTALLYGLLVLIGLTDQLRAIMLDHWGVVSTISGVLLGIGSGALLFLAQELNSEFGKYLAYLKADTDYLRAFQIQAVVFFLATLTPAVSAFWKDVYAIHFAWVLFIYACLNGLTLLTNVEKIVRLRQKFLIEYDKAKNSD